VEHAAQHVGAAGIAGATAGACLMRALESGVFGWYVCAVVWAVVVCAIAEHAAREED
jgi:uncharacterized membrane protein YeaQ/YmgE (transglycosylase-associated protein family)